MNGFLQAGWRRAKTVPVRALLLAALALAGLDRLWLLGLRRHAPTLPGGHRQIAVALGRSADFYITPWQAFLHFLLIGTGFLCVVLLILRARARR